MLLLLAVSVTPIETISLHFLLSVHLIQNVVLAEWAPLLAVLAIPPALAARAPRLWGLSPILDQQIAGVSMAAAESVVFFAFFAFFLARFFNEQDAMT